jgi:uncharacterized protein (TIGR03067 family)
MTESKAGPVKPIHLLLAVAVAVLPTARLEAQNVSSTAGDSVRLQGTWRMVSGAADGYPLASEYVEQMRRVFAGSDVTVTMGGQLFFRATVVLGRTDSIGTIDYHMTGGPTAGAIQLGIFTVSGDTARFCFAGVNAPRPSAFATTPGDGRTLSTWVRSAP